MKSTTKNNVIQLLNNDSHEEASEYFRLTLGLLGNKNLPPNPVVYSLCYEYVAGRNQQLIENLNEAFNSPNGLTPELSDELYKRFIWDDNQKIIVKLREAMGNIMSHTLYKVGQAKTNASKSTETLQEHSEKLAEAKSKENIQSILSKVVKETKKTIRNSQMMEKTLEETQQEVEALKKELARTKQEATTDPLTGLKNRRTFEQALIGLTAPENDEEHGDDICLAMIDIDFFKKVNDNHGHLVGDKVLIGVGTYLSANVKGKDLVARIGGEEFSVILPGTTLSKAMKLGESLRSGIERMRLKNTTTGELLDKITVSIGVAKYRNGETIEEFVDRADKALYQSKNNGRNQVTAYS